MMIVRRCSTPTTVLIALMLLGGFDGTAAERWSRQASKSEWIPLANPRAVPDQVPQDNARSSLHLPNPIQTLSLPPVLQHQYQEQLMQLQKTQESIQKLLLLQQQLRTQQQLLQTQTYPLGGFDAEDEKQALPPSTALDNLRTVSQLTPEVLVPPQPSSGALPPVYPSQNFLPQRPGQLYQTSHQNQNLNGNQELPSLPVKSHVVLQHGGDASLEDARDGLHGYVTKQGNQKPGGKRLRGHASPESPLIEGVGDEEEEYHLVYVPAETLAQRGQPKTGRRKQYPARQQLHREHQGNIEHSPLSIDQEAFARQVLQQIQKEHEEKAQFLKEERVKEFTRLNEEQKALERKTRLQQEALQREQELLRQKEAEKKRKELERLEEVARQRELERIRDAREKQRQEELERRRLAELRAKEERRREEEAGQREERQKQLELEQVLKQQAILENQQENQLRTTPGLLHQNAHSQALKQARRQQLADTAVRSKKTRGRQRQRVNQYQEQTNYREVATTPSPNQPPLSVYMGSPTSKLENVKVTDVLRLLKGAKTIAVLDNVGSNSPQVFVGPSNLDPPYGYAKFDLPYLSSLDHSRVERRVDKLPFFVAPLSFDPPSGYAKIPFPAPHIGSVVVNTLSDVSSDAPIGEQNPSPTPLIEPNSYSNADQSGSMATTASYETPTTPSYSPESGNSKYDSGSRFRQYYDNKPTTAIGASYYGEQSTAKAKSKSPYYEEFKPTTQPPKIETTVSYRQEVSYSKAPSFQDRNADSTTKEQDLAAQLALINQELAQQREAQRYNTAERYHSQANLGESYDVNDVRAPVESTQYNLPAELPPISPHLPGLVNSLLDKQERNLAVASTPPTTTTTTTTATTTTTMTTVARVNSTTYRPRGRGRIASRPKTTQAPVGKTNAERTRRPYNRSKSRFTTTTEEYHEPSYEPTKGKTLETTQRYSTVEHKRPTSRTQKYKSRDRTSSTAARDQTRNPQAQRTVAYENYPTQSDSQSVTSADPSTSSQKEITSPGMSDFARENYPPTGLTQQTENYPSLREMTAQHGVPLTSNDYSKSQTYPQNRPQDARYHAGMTYEQSDGFEQLERAPVNGFNYQAGNEETVDQSIVQRKEYPHYQDKLEDVTYHPTGTEDSRIRPDEEHRYSPIYDVAQTQPSYNVGEQSPFQSAKSGKIESGAIETDPNASPIFVPLQHSKQEEYELQIPSTETPLSEIITTSTTTPAPVIIRQRVRARLGGGRTHHDSAIQTQPRNSQDEYVRFSVVNHDGGRGASHRPRSRTRTRARPPHSQGSQVQTEGNEYIKIHPAQQQRLVATTTPPTTTTVTTTTVQSDEDVDYGFIRPPSFRLVHSQVQPGDNRFQAPITYRPAPADIQHIIPNDDTAVESSSAHVLKNRPKYHQTPTRRPATKAFAAITTSTTTEAIPVAIVPDDGIYATRPKVRPDESKPTRARGRVRRPSKKRTTTTTESALEAHNELPLDENYPRIASQQLPTTASGQQSPYNDNYDVSPQYVSGQNRPLQFYEDAGENYPPQEFILNFGNLPEQVPQREEYDQTQLASTPSGKYGHSDRANPTESDASAPPSSDIYGAESQWSTKLSQTSFQPSFAANRVTDRSKENRGETRDEQSDESPSEIITAGPEVSSAIVSYQKHGDGDTSTDIEFFGQKASAQDYAERPNVTATSSPSTTTPGTRHKERTDDATRVTKKVADPFNGRKGETRRRRVRVRVRPIVDDFVTAESQHYNSALNNLAQDQYKYNPIRESKFTTVQPIATTSAMRATTATTASVAATQKSMLQNFLEEMLKNDEVSIPTRVTSASGELPEWTIAPPTATSYADANEITTLRESYTPSIALTSSTDESAMVSDNSAASKDESGETISPLREQTTHLSQEEIEERKKVKSEKHVDEDSQEDKIERYNLENVELSAEGHNSATNYPDSLSTSEEVEDTAEEAFSTTSEGVRKPSIDKKREHIMTLKRQEDSIGENKAYPKNHRAKWSEVRYPTAFDKTQPKTLLKLHPTTPIPGVVTRNEGDGSVKTLSDYVKAIFDTMKSADEEEEEIAAKVVEAKDVAPVDKSGANDAVLASVEKTEGKADTIESRDALKHDSIKTERNSSSLAEAQRLTDTTTTESAAITFENTTSATDTAATTAVPSEEITTTESLTTTSSTTRTTTPIRRATDSAVKKNATETILSKVLKTSTTTKITHMTEICYRGRCVMTRPKMEGTTR